MWKQPQELKASLALKFNELILLLVCTSRQSLICPRGQLTKVVESKTRCSICSAQRVERLLCFRGSHSVLGSCCLWGTEQLKVPPTVRGRMLGHLCVEAEGREWKAFSHFLLECGCVSPVAAVFKNQSPSFVSLMAYHSCPPSSTDAQFTAFCMLIKGTTQHKVTAPKLTSSFKSPCCKADQTLEPVQTHSVWHTA